MHADQYLISYFSVHTDHTDLGHGTSMIYVLIWEYVEIPGMLLPAICSRQVTYALFLVFILLSRPHVPYLPYYHKRLPMNPSRPGLSRQNEEKECW